MKIAIISDTHLGDPSSTLLSSGSTTPMFGALAQAITRWTGGGPVDYLVLNGDTLDFSICSFHEALVAARPFFAGIAGLAKEIVYIPGNHDKHVWDALEWETGVIRSMQTGGDPKPFRRTVPGLLDYKSGGPIELKGVQRQTTGVPYGDIFLKGLFPSGTGVPIDVVYPNLYIRAPDDQVYMVSHGHMLELAWVLITELLKGDSAVAGKTTISCLEEHNVPVTSMICTGVGQSGPVTRMFYAIQQESKKGQTKRLKKALDYLIPNLDRLIQLPRYAEFLDNAALSILRRLVLEVADDVDASQAEDFFDRSETKDRLKRFYAASSLQANEDFGLPSPTKLIFGHTHSAIPASKPVITEEAGVALFNSGGWLPGNGHEIFFIDDQAAITSVSVS